MIEKIKTYWIPISVILIGILIYFSFTQNDKLVEKSNLLKASQDTLHTFKTTIGNQGAYISTLVGSKQDLINVLSSKDKKDSLNIAIIDSLKKDSKIQDISGVTTVTKVVYKDKLDSSLRKVSFQDSIKTEWYDAYVRVNNDTLGVNVNTRDKLLLTQKLKPNKGLFSGSTLTTYAQSLSPITNITGITSLSTIINKPSLAIRPAIGVGLNSDLKGSNIRLGYNLGVVLTIK